jgi:hypothetical protein
MTEQNPSGSTTPHAHRDEILAAEKRTFGGMKIGAAFFGWLAATGMAVLLTALLTGVGIGLGLATSTDPNEVAEQATQSATAVGIASAVLLALVALVSYFCGGYVAGRMARFDGAKQGIAVWLWAIVIAVVLAVAGLLAGSTFDILGQLGGLAGIPIDAGSLTTGGIITLVIAALLALVGAVLGGLAGMRFHRKVDRLGHEPRPDPAP